MTNYEHIKSMTIEEMEKILSTDDVLLAPCDSKYCPHFETDEVCTADKEHECKKATIAWLNAEYIPLEED